eukprot:6252454-Prymnesium_polylepis.1
MQARKCCAIAMRLLCARTVVDGVLDHLQQRRVGRAGGGGGGEDQWPRELEERVGRVDLKRRIIVATDGDCDLGALLPRPRTDVLAGVAPERRPTWQ